MSLWLKIEHDQARESLKEASADLAKEVSTNSYLAASLGMSERLIKARARFQACEVAVNHGVTGVEDRISVLDSALAYLTGAIESETFDVVTWGTYFDHSKWLELTEERKVLTAFHKQMSILK